MNYLIADYGTSSCRASIVDDTGSILASCRRATSVAVCGDSAVVGPDQAWKNAAAVIRELIDGNPEKRIDAVGFSAMLGWVLLDSSNQPVGDCISWMDRRTGSGIVESFSAPETDAYAKTGRRFSPELFAAKWGWLLENNPAAASAAVKIIGLKDEFLRRLTGTVVSDPAHMNYTMLWNIRDNEADPQLLEAAGIEASMLPEVLLPYEAAGSVTAEAAASTGLRQGTPVICGSIDGTTAMYGGGMYEPGRTVHVSGTTDVLMTLTRNYPPELSPERSSLTINNGFLPGTYAAGGATGTSGGALMKLCSLLAGDCTDLIAGAAELPPGAEGLILGPGLAGERAPYWEAGLGGTVAGLRMEHGPEHIIRAAMEGAAFRLRRLAADIFRLEGCRGAVQVVGGGSRNDCWNRIKADVLGIPFSRPVEIEATTTGTAMFCECAVNGGGLADVGRRWIVPETEFQVNTGDSALYIDLFNIWEEHINRSIDTCSALGAYRGVHNGSDGQ